MYSDVWTYAERAELQQPDKRDIPRGECCNCDGWKRALSGVIGAAALALCSWKQIRNRLVRAVVLAIMLPS